LLTAHAHLNVVTDAVNQGAIYKFLTKPWDNDTLRASLREAFRVHARGQRHPPHGA